MEGNISEQHSRLSRRPLSPQEVQLVGLQKTYQFPNALVIIYDTPQAWMGAAE